MRGVSVRSKRLLSPFTLVQHGAFTRRAMSKGREQQRREDEKEKGARKGGSERRSDMSRFEGREKSKGGALAGAYHSCDFKWEDLKVDAEKVLAERNLDFMTAEREERFCDQEKRWESFHKVHSTAKFFKERRYILQEFPQLLGKHVQHVVEFGCGNGSSVIPLLKGNPVTKVTAVDFSESAVVHAEESVKQAGIDLINRCTLFPCDLSQSTKDKEPRLYKIGCDAVLMMFMLSAVPPNLMHQTIENAFHCLKPGGLVFFRDYGMYDLTQLRFPQDQRLGQKLYHRGDGTLSYFFTLEELRSMFQAKDMFETVETDYVCVELYNRKKNFPMKRVFAHAVFKKQEDQE